MRLITAKSKGFPDGPKEAFNALESHLTTLKRRKFYGLSYDSDEGTDYYAGLVPDDELEELRFADLGFPTKEIEGGSCVRVKLLDWSSKIDQLGPAFGAMSDEYGFDATRPRMEFYRSMTELHLLLPVPSSIQPRSHANNGGQLRGPSRMARD